MNSTFPGKTEALCVAKVCDFDGAGVGQEDVLGLQVAVGDAHFVHVGDTLHDLLEEAICFELFESQNSTGADEPSSFNYSIRISLSPGCHTFDPLDVQLDSKHCIGIAQRRSLTSHHDWMQVIETLRDKFHTVKLPKSFIAINLSEKVPQAFGMKAENANQ